MSTNAKTHPTFEHGDNYVVMVWTKNSFIPQKAGRCYRLKACATAHAKQLQGNRFLGNDKITNVQVWETRGYARWCHA
jgi:hypothetical protein